jgi:hypothetical protein
VVLETVITLSQAALTDAFSGGGSATVTFLAHESKTHNKHNIETHKGMALERFIEIHPQGTACCALIAQTSSDRGG